MLKTVTISGADDGTNPESLLELSKKYPFVEFGILFSGNTKRRFPSLDWLEELFEIYRQNQQMNLSLHLCGQFVNELVLGRVDFLMELKHLFAMFKRVQINFAGHGYIPSDAMYDVMNLFKEREFIFQLDGVNNHLVYEAKAAEVNCSGLFDSSYGKGTKPEFRDTPLKGIKIGYAGGINPKNITSEIQLLNDICSDQDYWIDMETGVRNKSNIFDLTLVENCLAQADKFINPKQ